MDLALMEDAQKPPLRLNRQLADPVEKKRSALRLDAFANGFFGGAGERPLFAANQHPFEIVRRGAAIEGHELASAPARSPVACAGENFLAGAGPASENRGNGGLRPPLPRRDGRSHFHAVAREVL